MTAYCAACGHALNSDLVADLRAEARQRGFSILPGDFIREIAAASLMDRRPSTLEKWRQTDARLPYRKDRAGRVTYSLKDIAAFIQGDEPEKGR